MDETETTVGKRVGGDLYLHVSALEAVSIPAEASAALAAARDAAIDWNVLKTGKSGTSLLLYEDFDKAAFPALLESWRFDPARCAFRRTSYSGRDNPPILHRKELLLGPDHPARDGYSALTADAAAAGLFEKPLNAIGTRNGWRERMREKNAVLKGGRITVADGNGDVRREKTAMRRSGPSQPLSAMLRTGMLSAEHEFLDYGCGHGDDVAFLQANGYAASGWDPYHRPDAARHESDVVALSYVLNVIEDARERRETLASAWSLARRGLCVAVMHWGMGETHRQTPHADGFLTSRGTFQKYFSQSELVAYVAEVTGERPLVLGGCIVAAFRDKDLEQQVASRARYGRTADMAAHPGQAARHAAEAAKAQARIERAGKAVAALAETMLSLGRIPEKDELPPLARRELAKKSISYQTAVTAAAAALGDGALQAAADRRTRELVVHFALALVPGAPTYSSLPTGLKRDVRTFFGSLAAVKERAMRELVASGRPSAFADAQKAAAEAGLGTLEEGVLRFAGKVSDRLPVHLRIVIGCGEMVHPGISDGDFLELGPSPWRVTAHRTAEAASIVPTLIETVSVDIGKSRSKVRSHNGRLLYLKSRYMEHGDPKYAAQAAADAKLLASGVVTSDGRGPPADKFSALVRRAATGAAG